MVTRLSILKKLLAVYLKTRVAISQIDKPKIKLNFLYVIICVLDFYKFMSTKSAIRSLKLIYPVSNPAE